MRVIENVLVGTYQNKIRLFRYTFQNRQIQDRRREKVVRAVDILKDIGLGNRINDYAQNLPYGEQRKVEIARNCYDAKIILLDEPVAG